jgi:hypothetical protein
MKVGVRASCAPADIRTVSEIERALKEAANRFRPRRNIGLATTKALYCREEPSLKSNLDRQVHWCISPNHHRQDATIFGSLADGARSP